MNNRIITKHHYHAFALLVLCGDHVIPFVPDAPAYHRIHEGK